jgi:hypothetical protein
MKIYAILRQIWWPTGYEQYFLKGAKAKIQNINLSWYMQKRGVA